MITRQNEKSGLRHQLLCCSCCGTSSPQLLCNFDPRRQWGSSNLGLLSANSSSKRVHDPLPLVLLGSHIPREDHAVGPSRPIQLAVKLNSHYITPALLSPSQPWQHPPSSILFPHPHSCPLVLFCDHGHTTGPSSTHWLIRYTFLFYSINEFYSLTIFSFSLPTTWISPIHVSPFFFINISPTFITFV